MRCGRIFEVVLFVFHTAAVSQILDSLEDVQCLTDTSDHDVHFLQDVFEDVQLHALLNVSPLSLWYSS